MAAAKMPRLVIKEMILENFKSYVGEQRVGPFHKSFSSVVGPNGSGKSNVIDALLFVFGKRAKQLRLNKVSELIHNSSNYQNLEFARVTVNFHEIVDHDDDEGFDVVPNSELVVAREAHRDNSSKYILNGKNSTFTDVTKVLKGKGVDLDNNRFLILQGEVEQISMMKPKAQGPHDEGLLEYLEDIIGTNCYVERISEASKKLEELNEQRTSQVQRLKVTEKEKDGLSGAKAEAEEFISKERELLRQRGVQYQLHVALAQANITKLREQKEELEAKLVHERKKQKDFEESVSSQQATFSAAQREYDELTKELERVEKEFKEFERKDVRLREDLKAAKAKFKKAEEKHAKGAKQAEELRELTEALGKEVPLLEQKGAAAEAALAKEEAKLDGMLAGLRAELEALGAQLATVQGELAPWEARISEASARVDVAAAERDLLVGKREGAQRRLREARDGAETAKVEADARDAEAKKLGKEMASKQRDAAAARKEEAAAREREGALRGQVQGARSKAEELRRSAHEEKSQSGLLAALMHAKSKGHIPGIHGRLGDLGAIDAKYDVAVSMAGGGALDNIVVETTSDAQKCVELLRKNSLGVATFLILEKQQGLEAESRQAVEAPEGIPRLIDLVRPASDRLRVAFYYALRNTTVAKDIEQASRIAYGADKRFRRVVTLDGKLIESSGTMSGGGATPKGGRMRVGNSAPRVAESTEEVEKALKAAEADLDTLEGDLRLAIAALEETGRRATELEKAAAALERRERLERMLPKLAMEAESLRSKAADLLSQLSSLEAAAKAAAEDDARLKAVEKEVAAAERALTEVRSGAAGLHAKAAKLQKQMDDAGGPQLKAARASVQRLQEEIDAFTSGAAQKRATIAANAKSAAKLDKSVADADTERAKLQEEMEKAKAELRTIEERALDVQEQCVAARAACCAKQEELVAIKEQHKEIEKQLNTIRSVEEDLKNLLEESDRSLKENDKKAKHWDAQLAKNRRERAEAEGMAELPPVATEEELARVNEDAVAERITLLESELASMKPDMSAIAAWQKKEEEYCRRVEELRVVTEGRDSIKKEHDELRKRRLEEFMAGFDVISLKLKEMYQMITLGGDAELELVDSLDPFSEGIVFSVRPPKKSWKHIANLSGGEKTLSSLALVFALHHYKPTPLYVMDEIDAALDFKNVSIVAHYIKERTKNAQFVIISLRNNMFELADRLVGIYKTDNATKSITINPGLFGVSNMPLGVPVGV